MSRKIVSPASEFSLRRLMPEVEKDVENTCRACGKYHFVSKNQLYYENKTAGQSLFASPLCNQCRPVRVVTSAPQFLCCYISSAVIRRYRFS